MKNRSSVTYKARYALQHPDRIKPYLSRWARDTWLRIRARDHISYYRAVMRYDATKSADGAVGTSSRDRWLAIGKMQFDYLVEHGLKPQDRMLEIGCGNLRAGWRFIQYLDAGNYYGIDISPDILFAAEKTIVDYDLQGKLPHLTPVRNLELEFLPDRHFTVIHAHSVFSHSPLSVIEECFANIGRILHPDGFFDFTFDRTDGKEHQVLREDFYYRTETLVELARKHGLEARLMEDWESRPHKQSKIRVRPPTG